jgi:hypothetical protein
MVEKLRKILSEKEENKAIWVEMYKNELDNTQILKWVSKISLLRAITAIEDFKDGTNSLVSEVVIL